MQKWTRNPGEFRANLAQILSVRPHLNEIECLALLGQIAHALQDVLLKSNGRRSTGAAGRSHVMSRKMDEVQSENCPVIFPERIFATSSGKIQLDASDKFNVKPDFIHPLLAKNQLYRSSYSEKELEQMGVYSLGKTIQLCLSTAQADNSKLLSDLLVQMTSAHDNVSLLQVLQFVSTQWTILVGSSPISQFVAQLAKLTLTWNAMEMRQQQLEISHIEFSKLNDSTSSSGSTSPILPPKKLPLSSSPIHNNNNRPPKLPPRKPPNRNPSRLYRVVKPLAEISINPSPATNKCVGPEFHVIGECHPKILDLATNHSRKDFVSKQVDVVMLNGQRYFIHVNAASITAGEVLDNVLRDQDLKEANLFSLAVKSKDDAEYWPLSNDTKLAKIAPLGWKDPKLAGPNNRILGENLILYQRVKYLPTDIDNSFKDSNNKHQFYLQLRQDVLSGLFPMSVSDCLSLAGMALQVEFGDFSHDIHSEAYFDLNHYLPVHILNSGIEPEKLRSDLVKLHRAHQGQSQSKTEIKFCKELMRHDNYGFHFFQVFSDKKLCTEKFLGIHLQGLFLFDPSSQPDKPLQVTASFFWHKITRIQYDTGKFQLLINGIDKLKLKFYTHGHNTNQSKVMFDLASSHHQYSNQLRLNLAKNRVEYKEPPRPMRSLKSKLLNKRQSSQHKLYTTRSELESQSSRNLKRSTTETPSKMSGKSSRSDQANYLVKRLAHYSSMADALGANKTNSSKASNTKDSDLNVSDKENKTPDRNYRYKVYLEPEEDIPRKEPARAPLQERPALAEMSATPVTSLSTKRIATSASVTTNPKARRKSENLHHRRSSGVKKRIITTPMTSTASNAASDACPSSVLRMGTRISLSALHRERLRLTSDILLNNHHSLKNGLGGLDGLTGLKPMQTLDLDYDTMEFKSILPSAASEAAVVSLHEADSVPYSDPGNESLSESLMERFDNMETDWPERQILPVTVIKDPTGKLGLKITGDPSGIYVEEFDPKMLQPGHYFRKGDRIVAINGRSLENVKYEHALDMMRKSSGSVQFLVSQIKD